MFSIQASKYIFKVIVLVAVLDVFKDLNKSTRTISNNFSLLYLLLTL